MFCIWSLCFTIRFNLLIFCHPFGIAVLIFLVKKLYLYSYVKTVCLLSWKGFYCCHFSFSFPLFQELLPPDYVLGKLTTKQTFSLSQFYMGVLRYVLQKCTFEKIFMCRVFLCIFYFCSFAFTFGLSIIMLSFLFIFFCFNFGNI